MHFYAFGVNLPHVACLGVFFVALLAYVAVFNASCDYRAALGLFDRRFCFGVCVFCRLDLIVLSWCSFFFFGCRARPAFGLVFALGSNQPDDLVTREVDFFKSNSSFS